MASVTTENIANAVRALAILNDADREVAIALSRVVSDAIGEALEKAKTEDDDDVPF